MGVLGSGKEEGEEEANSGDDLRPEPLVNSAHLYILSNK